GSEEDAMRVFRAAWVPLVVGLAAVLALATGVNAQIQGGTVSGTVNDEQGGVLPGVVVSLAGPDATQTFVSDASGKDRFINVAPGIYKVSAALAGFTTAVRENIEVKIGQAVEIPMSMKVAAVAESVTVSGESPIVDTKQMGTGTNFTQSELAAIPTSRDPF